MYDPISGELDSSIAKLPESLEQPRVLDLVIGQYAMLDVDAVWVDEIGDVRVVGTYPLDTIKSAQDGGDYVRIVRVIKGIVIDPIDLSDGLPVLFERTPISVMMKDDLFDIDKMLPVCWVVANTVQRDMLRLMYAKDTNGGELYYEHGASVKKAAKVKPAKQKTADIADKPKGQGKSIDNPTEE